MHTPLDDNIVIEMIGMRLLGLNAVRQISVGMYPDGFYDDDDPDKRYGYDGLEFKDPNNEGARIVVLWWELSERRGNGQNKCGLCIGSVFVVDKVVNNKVKLKMEKNPRAFCIL